MPIDTLKDIGFLDIRLERPGSIQLIANHQSGVGIWFYAKHSIASLTIYNPCFATTKLGKTLHDVVNSPENKEVDYLEHNLSDYKGDDMGCLMEDSEIIELVNAMWNEHLQEKGDRQ
jgi:hypothetical protein